MGLFVHSHISNQRNTYVSIGHSASGLRAYARVIPAGFIGHHRGVHRVTYLRGDHRRWIPGSAYRGLPLDRPCRRIASLIKSHREPDPTTRHIFSSCFQCQRRECISRSRNLALRFSRFNAPIETLSHRHPLSPLYLQRNVWNRKKKKEKKEKVRKTQRLLRDRRDGLIWKRKIKTQRADGSCERKRVENANFRARPARLCQRAICTGYANSARASCATMERYTAVSRVNIIRTQNRSIIIKQTRWDGWLPKHTWTNMITSLMWTFRSI